MRVQSSSRSSIQPPPPFAALPLALGLLALAWLAPAAATAQGATVNATLLTDPSRPQGTDSQGRLRLHAPNPLELGSSVSHWDLIASPDLLMEPSNSPLLAFAQLDLTLPALQDLGWHPGSANITLRILDGANTGFNDPQRGAERLAAMRFVAQRWAAVLGSSVEINVGVSFQSLPCSQGSGVLAQAQAIYIFEDFPGAPLPNTWYHGALAESLSGQNLSLEDTPNNPDAPDIIAQFNSRIDQECLSGGTGFYYGLDGNVPQGRISFVNVALHEVAHGLGFASLSEPRSGQLVDGMVGIYDRQLFDTDLGRGWHQMTPGERVTSAVNTGGLVWSGPRVNAQAPGLLAPSLVVRINSPVQVAETFAVAPAQFGPRVPAGGLQGDLALGRDGSSEPSLGCNALVNGGEIASRIAVLDRGICNFTVKVRNAQDAGAIAVIVVNNVAGTPIPMGGTDPSIVIPAVHMSQEDGRRLQDALTLGVPPRAPSDLTAQPLPGGRGRLTWTDNSDNETGFRIERRRGGAGGFQLRTTTGPNTTSFVDSGLVAGDAYTYRVRAQGAAGPSPFSNNASLVAADLPEVPDPPTGVRASPLTTSSVLLTWEPPAGGAESFVVQAQKIASREPDGTAVFDRQGFATVDEVDGSASQAILDGLQPSTTYNLRVLARNESGESPFAGPVAATTGGDGGPAPCAGGPTTLCLLDDRFEVRAFFQDQFNGGTGDAKPLDFSSDSGLFWFFDPQNVELITKMIDARTLTGSFWFFYGALSNVEYWIVVTDTQEGDVRTYYNPPNVLGAEADTRAFLVPQPENSVAGNDLAGAGVAGTVVSLPASPTPAPWRPISAAGADAGPCVANATTLCLLGDRFEVTVEWSDPRNGGNGEGMALPLAGNDTTGTFYFFQPENLELLVKVLDGRAINGRFWVFFGGLTDLPYTLRVRDSVTGDSAEYVNPFGDLVGETDTDALDPE